MTGRTKRNKVVIIVGLIWIIEHSERDDVMDMELLSRSTDAGTVSL